MVPLIEVSVFKLTIWRGPRTETLLRWRLSIKIWRLGVMRGERREERPELILLQLELRVRRVEVVRQETG